MSELERELRSLLTRHADTPLAQYLLACLTAFNVGSWKAAVQRRERFEKGYTRRAPDGTR